MVWPNRSAKFRSDEKQLDAEGNSIGVGESEDEAEDDFIDCLTLTTDRLEQLDLDESAAAMQSLWGFVVLDSMNKNVFTGLFEGAIEQLKVLIRNRNGTVLMLSREAEHDFGDGVVH